jgi:aldehyde dehydrogenase (NAD+)
MATTTTTAVEVETDLSHYIGGQWTEPTSDETVDIVNPATEQVIARVAAATPSDAEQAIRSARTAFDEGPWPRLSGKERGRILRQFADALWEHRDLLVDIAVRQGGCTITQARGMQVYFPIQTMYRYAELAEREMIEQTSIGDGSMAVGDGPRVGHTIVKREPAGVISAITPFNYPTLLNLQKIGPALASGNTMVLKPTEYICRDAYEIARIAHEETDLPPGVLNVLMGGRGDVGEVLTSHPMVDQVTFTGSTQIGRMIMANAAPTVKRVTLELGGKSANIIFADADLDKVLSLDSALVIRHCGQGCGHWTRVLVEESLHDELLEHMVARAKTVVVGDPMDPATEMGPLVSGVQWDRVKGYIDSGVEEGANLVAGGGRPAGLDVGYYMEPTVFDGTRSDMKIFQEEIFGPVVSVQSFRTEEEAIALANDSIYGLNGAVWSGDLARGLRVANAVRTGSITVNGGGSSEWGVPYGGYKQSGLGREFGEWGFQEYTELKTIRYMAG